ncbi:MAG TPA: DUF2130 domain-containing protein [Candidatus Sulfotelmatobacter sp.]|nr:DUF2130 domain-containing protein [Candidatus Sulfotelmatobacter sp.]
MNDIKCPHCGKVIHIEEAVRQELEKTILKDQAEKQKMELERAKLQIAKETEEKFKQEVKLEIQKNEKEKELLEKKLEESLRDQEKREEKIRISAIKDANESSRLEKKEYEKKISDMQKTLEDAQRKAKQGSQQLQGEVLELDLEEKLRQTFTNDEFLPVPKGVEGADIWQKIRFNGKEVGSILWETKRTKAWSNLWLSKLKDDSAKISASEAIIVSQVLPEGVVSFGREQGIWVTTYEHAINIARYVSFLIKALAKVKSGASQTDEDWTKVRDYMLSDSFKHRMQAHFDAVKSLREMLDTEKRTSTLRWTRQQKQIDKLDANTVNFYAELKDIVHNLPELESIELPQLLSENEDNQESLI